MSGLNWGVGDLLTVTKLAWDLYHKCYLAAREAPDDFRQFVNELASLQGVLRTLRDDVASDNSFLQHLGDSRKEVLERCLGSCFDTLHKLQKLVNKYQDLGAGDGKQFWTKLSWVGKKREIADLKSRIMVHTCNLSLCMSSIGNSSLARIETSMIKALERQEASKTSTETVEESTPLTPCQTAPVVSASKETSEGPEDLGLQRITRSFTGATLVESGSNFPANDDELSEDGSPGAVTNKARQTAAGKRRRSPTASAEYDGVILPLSPVPSDAYCMGGPDSVPQNAKEVSSSPLASRNHSRKCRIDALVHEAPAVERSAAPSLKWQDHRPHSVVEAVADAMEQLSKARKNDRPARALRVVPEDPSHQPDTILSESFQHLAKDESSIRTLNARHWLRVATWWLLKARYNATDKENSISPGLRLSRISDDSKASTNQAYVDLLKSVWILHSVILHEDNAASLMTDENRKLFYTLSDGINETLSRFHPPDDSGRSIIMDQNLSIWELLQPEEDTFREKTESLGPDNQRWITVEQVDAGEEDETVIYRTFVNAAVGSKKYRINSRGAPYMLLLSTKVGESQPKITVCNQSGTMSLTKEFTPADLMEDSTQISPSAGGVAGTDVLPLNFGKMNITIAFVDLDDQQRFMNFPRKYFDSVKRREPCELKKATETLLFDRSVEVFEQLRPSNLSPFTPRQQSWSCNLRILEATGKEGWRVTRRLVMSSSAAEKRPWCTEVFLPLSNVRIKREGNARAAIVKWSDCSHEHSDQTDGNYNRVYSYVYDENDPNIAIGLVFRSSKDAADFENIVLQMSVPPILSQSKGPDSLHVYNISDREGTPKDYKAILVTHTRFDWRYSELVYMYRDTDFQFCDRVRRRLRLPHVYHTNYISSHNNQLYKPEPGVLPVFSHCEKGIGTLTIGFDNEDDVLRFMSSLTTRHELVFWRRARYVAERAPSKWLPTKPGRCPADVQLWKAASAGSHQLLVRRDGKVQDQWMSLPAHRGMMKQAAGEQDHGAPQLTVCTARKVPYQRGRRIDMAALVATDSKEMGERNTKVGPVTICFESVADREASDAKLEEAAGADMVM